MRLVRPRTVQFTGPQDGLDQVGGFGRGDAVSLVYRRETVIETQRHDPAGIRRMQERRQPHGLAPLRRLLHDDHLGP